MTFRQALLYFLAEALRNLIRSWKVSVLAILTIAVSLFLGGFFYLVTQNLSDAVVEWGSELKVVIYLKTPAADSDTAALKQRITSPVWVSSVREVSSSDARRLFQQSFPSLADLVVAWEEEPFPPSLEVTVDSKRIDRVEYESWLTELEGSSQVGMVDDDRDWLSQFDDLLTLVRSVGLVLGLVLLGAAIFTIASVVRLTAYLYLEEIAVMRLVGATEFYIRGPFYLEGLVQGLVGGGVALLALSLAYGVLEGNQATSIWLALLLSKFLTWQEQGSLLAFGGAAGLLGAVLSLRRESLERESQD